MSEKILTLHPEGKQGVNIEKVKYDQMRVELLNIIRSKGQVSFSDLSASAKEQLAGKFEGSIGWYMTTVKLDLEARGEIERIPGSRPQLIRLK
ncbi:MAG: hypothetical protein AAF990_22595 [Bacteroidota bacterium]